MWELGREILPVFNCRKSRARTRDRRKMRGRNVWFLTGVNGVGALQGGCLFCSSYLTDDIPFGFIFEYCCSRNFPRLPPCGCQLYRYQNKVWFQEWVIRYPLRSKTQKCILRQNALLWKSAFTLESHGISWIRCLSLMQLFLQGAPTTHFSFLKSKENSVQ